MSQNERQQHAEVRIAVRRDAAAADLPFPRYMTPGASGVDLHAAIPDQVIVRLGEIHRIPTGLFFEIPAGFEGQVRPRSGLAFERGLTVVNAPGTIDSDYRGEIQVIVTCLSATPCVIRRGMRFAQMVFAPVARATFDIVDELSGTARGARGFGHTGLGSAPSPVTVGPDTGHAAAENL